MAKTKRLLVRTNAATDITVESVCQRVLVFQDSRTLPFEGAKVEPPKSTVVEKVKAAFVAKPEPSEPPRWAGKARIMYRDNPQSEWIGITPGLPLDFDAAGRHHQPGTVLGQLQAVDGDEVFGQLEL